MDDIAQQTKCGGDVPSPFEHRLDLRVATITAVLTSSVVVAVAKIRADSNLELPMAAAAAAVVVATTAAVAKQFQNFEAYASSLSDQEGHGSCDRRYNSFGRNSEGDRISDRSTGNNNRQSDVTLDDVADCEIPWEEINLGDRIGIGACLFYLLVSVLNFSSLLISPQMKLACLFYLNTLGIMTIAKFYSKTTQNRASMFFSIKTIAMVEILLKIAKSILSIIMM